MRVADVVAPTFATVGESTSIREAVRLFRQLHLDALPVTAPDGRLTGLVTRSNLYDVMLDGVSLELPVSSVMVRDPRWVHAAEAFPVGPRISDATVGQVVVVDDEHRPVGLLTKGAVVQALLRVADALMRNLRAVVDAIEYGVVAVDNSGIVTVFNRPAAEMAGLEPEQVIGLPAAVAVPDIGLDRVLATGEVIERRRHTVGGRVVLVNCRPVPGPEGAVGAVAVLHDMTRLELTARELESTQQLNRMLDTVLNIGHDGVVAVDREGYITLVNRNLSEFLGRSAGELIGRPITEVMPSTRLPAVARSGVPEYGDVQVIRGTRCVMSCHPIIRDGNPAGAVGKVSLQGVGELRAIVRKLEAMERRLDTYREASQGARYTFDHIVGTSPALERAKSEARRAAPGDLPVLLLGPSGTGKELFAHAIHNLSPRRSGPFVKVNCAAIPAELLESEFFGYEPGAFTGARSQGKPGKFELADGGTLFLDEIGDMSLSLQAKLLRVLQDGEFERVGSVRPIRVNVRVIAATHRDLAEMIRTGQFRLDLYYRLNVVAIKIPSLAERRDDIPGLVEFFIDKYSREAGTSISGAAPEAIEVLKRYEWPGNVRELENVIRRAIYLAEGDVIEVRHLPPDLAQSLPGMPAPPLHPPRDRYTLEFEAWERKLVLEALEAAGGNRSRAARLLGIGRATLYEKLRRLGIPTRKNGREGDQDAR